MVLAKTQRELPRIWPSGYGAVFRHRGSAAKRDLLHSQWLIPRGFESRSSQSYFLGTACFAFNFYRIIFGAALFSITVEQGRSNYRVPPD